MRILKRKKDWLDMKDSVVSKGYAGKSAKKKKDR